MDDAELQAVFDRTVLERREKGRRKAALALAVGSVANALSLATVAAFVPSFWYNYSWYPPLFTLCVASPVLPAVSFAAGLIAFRNGADLLRAGGAALMVVAVLELTPWLAVVWLILDFTRSIRNHGFIF